MHLHTLTDDELERYAHTVHDDLTATPLQTELLRRFIDSSLAAQTLAQVEIDPANADDLAQLSDAIDLTNEVDASELRAYLAAIRSKDIADLDGLRSELRMAEILREAGIYEPAAAQTFVNGAAALRGVLADFDLPTEPADLRAYLTSHPITLA